MRILLTLFFLAGGMAFAQEPDDARTDATDPETEQCTTGACFASDHNVPFVRVRHDEAVEMADMIWRGEKKSPRPPASPSSTVEEH